MSDLGTKWRAQTRPEDLNNAHRDEIRDRRYGALRALDKIFARSE